MLQHLIIRVQGIVVGISVFIVLLLVSACAGVPTYNNGSSNTSLTPSTTQSTSSGTQPTTTSAAVSFSPGELQFIGTVNSVSSNTITVSMPDNNAFTMNVTAATDRSKFNGGLPTNGQQVKATATANPDGSFTATKLDTTDSKDTTSQSIVNYKGVTTSTVGTDRVLHFKVGTKSWGYPFDANTNLKDFNGDPQTIQANQPVKVSVQFNGLVGTVLTVENSNSSNS